MDFCIVFLYFLFILVSIEKTSAPLKTVFDQISKHLEFHQKYPVACHIFNSLLSVTARNLVTHSLSCLTLILLDIRITYDHTLI